MQLTTCGPQSFEDKADKGMAMRFEILPIPVDGSLGWRSRMVLVMEAGPSATVHVETRRGRLDGFH